MSRKLQGKINTDRVIVDLRMEAEELINAMERITDNEFRTESKRISDAIDKRVEELYRENRDD